MFWVDAMQENSRLFNKVGNLTSPEGSGKISPFGVILTEPSWMRSTVKKTMGKGTVETVSEGEKNSIAKALKLQRGKLICENPVRKTLVNLRKSKTCQHVLGVEERVMKRS